MENIVKSIKLSAKYLNNVEYGIPRSGHPEGKLKFHIADLEANLEKLKQMGISDDQYWKLQFLIQVHDLFKAEESTDYPPQTVHRHAVLAKQYATQFTDDEDLLNMIQYHDANYHLWKEFKTQGKINEDQFANLLRLIKDWDLFLMFVIIDGCTKGKDYEKIGWFINEVKKYKVTKVGTGWILAP